MLDEEKVAAIKGRLAMGHRAFRVAMEMGVSETLVYHVARGRTWKHVRCPIVHVDREKLLRVLSGTASSEDVLDLEAVAKEAAA